MKVQHSYSYMNLLDNPRFGVFTRRGEATYDTIEGTGTGEEHHPTSCATDPNDPQANTGIWSQSGFGSMSATTYSTKSCLQLVTSGVNTTDYVYFQVPAGDYVLIPGRLYRFRFYLAKDLAAQVMDYVRTWIGDGAYNNQDIAYKYHDISSWTTSTDWHYFDQFFVANDTTRPYGVVSMYNNASGKNIYLAEATIWEVEPTSEQPADNSPWTTADGWVMSTAPATTVVKKELADKPDYDGNAYSLRISNTSGEAKMFWPWHSCLLDDSTSVNFYYLNKFRGQHLSLGAWVKSSSSNVGIFIEDGTTTTEYAYHTGGGDWEWLKINKTVSKKANLFRCGIHRTSGSGAVQFYKPILIYGKHVESSMWSHNPNTVTFVDRLPVRSENFYQRLGQYTHASMYPEAKYTDSLPSMIDKVPLNVEADTIGGLPCYAKGVFCQISFTSTTLERYLIFAPFESQDGYSGDTYGAFKYIVHDTSLPVDATGIGYELSFECGTFPPYPYLWWYTDSDGDCRIGYMRYWGCFEG